MKPAILAGAGVVAMLIGYSAGRFAQPARVEVREKVVEKVVTVTAKEQESASAETSKSDIRFVTRWRIRDVTKPDGSVVHSAEGSTGERTEEAASHKEAKRETEVRYVDRTVEKVVEKVVTRADGRGWAIDARAGAVIAGSHGGLQGIGPFVYGGTLTRRLFGGVSAGVYATTATEVGLVARVEW